MYPAFVLVSFLGCYRAENTRRRDIRDRNTGNEYHLGEELLKYPLHLSANKVTIYGVKFTCFTSVMSRSFGMAKAKKATVKKTVKKTVAKKPVAKKAAVKKPTKVKKAAPAKKKVVKVKTKRKPNADLHEADDGVVCSCCGNWFFSYAENRSD